MKTGFSPVDLDAGGFEEGRLYLVRGSSGTGKTVFGLQYLAEGLQHDQPGVLVTTEQPEDVLAYARSLGFDLEPALKTRRLTILTYPLDLDEFVRPSLQFGLEDILREFRAYGNDSGAQRWVIDTLNPLFSFARSFSSTEFGRSIASMFTHTGGTFLLLEDSGDTSVRALSSALEASLSGLFELAHEGPTLRRVFRIKKLRRQRPPSLEFPFQIRYGQGLCPLSDEGPTTYPALEETGGDLLPAFRRTLIQELRRTKRCNHPLSVLILSLSDSIRSEQGADEGGLNELLRTCRRQSREFDTVARYGPDSVIAILPCADRHGATLYAQKIQMAFPHTRYSVHLGIATYPHDAEEDDALIQKAFVEIGAASLNGKAPS